MLNSRGKLHFLLQTFPRKDISRVGRYLKNQLTIIVMENIAIIDNIAINEIEKNEHIFQVQLTSKHV